MAAYIAIAVAFAVGFVLRVRGWRWWAAFLASCLVVPVFIVAVVLCLVLVANAIVASDLAASTSF